MLLLHVHVAVCLPVAFVMNVNAVELTVPCLSAVCSSPLDDDTAQRQLSPRQCNFGHSLLADYSEHYMPDFVLQGTSDVSVLLKLQQDLRHSVTCSVLDEHISESVALVADTDKWCVHLLLID